MLYLSILETFTDVLTRAHAAGLDAVLTGDGIEVTRDSMCRVYRHAGNENARYEAALAVLQSAAPGQILSWGLKTDDVLYLECRPATGLPG